MFHQKLIQITAFKLGFADIPESELLNLNYGGVIMSSN